jgi:Flp pilus assembly protein TadG
MLIDTFDRWSSAGRAHVHDRRGSAALELTLAAPLLLLLVIGVYDISEALILQQELYNASHTIVTSASNVAVQPNASTSLTVAQVQQALSGIYAAMPTLRGGLQTGVHSATLTSISVQQADPNCIASASNACAYVAYAMWSVSYADPPGRFAGNLNTFSSVTRCPTSHTPLKQVPPTQYTPGTLTSLPIMNVTTPTPTLVADVHYQYSPRFLSYITGPVDFWATSLWPVRSVNQTQAEPNQYTQYDLANAANGAGQCP